MNKLLTTKQLLPLLTGLTSAIIGILVLWGWYTNNTALIQIRSDLAGMPYNTALCFFASGVALLIISKNYRLLPFLLGMFVLLVSGLNLAEYIFNVHTGIDQLFIKAYPPFQGVPSGRMSPNGALALSLIGASLLLQSHYLTLKVSAKSLLSIVFVMSLIALILSLVAIFGYMATLPGTYGWGRYIEMAFHTACTNILLSIGIISMTRAKASDGHISFSLWSPLFVFIAVAVITLLYWDAAWAYVEKNEQKQNTMAAISIKNLINEELKSREADLLRMVNRWKMRPGGTPYEEWSQDARNIISDEPGYQAIEWVDPMYHVRWIEPLKGNEIILNHNIAGEEQAYRPLRLAIEKNTVVTTPILTLKTGNKGFLLYVPIIDRGEKKIHGTIVGAIDAKIFFDTVLMDEVPDYNVAVYAENQLVYQRNPHQAAAFHHNSVTLPSEEFGWSIVTWVKPELLMKQHSWLPTSVLFIGFIIALSFSLIAYLAQIAKNSATSARKEIDRRKKTEQQLVVYSEKLKKLSLLDALTGTNNRRALSKVLDEAIQQLRDTGTSFSVLLLDIDHFKNINDTYGHVTGDYVLQRIGSILREKMRADDTIARYGGEEFCIVLPNTSDRQAYEIAERLRLLISEMVFYCEKKEPFHITCSIGVHQVHSEVQEVNKVFEVVDAALYKAKNLGRNCVVMEQAV